MSGQGKRSRLRHLESLREKAECLIARACPGYVADRGDSFDVAKVRGYCGAMVIRGGSEAKTAARVLAMLAGKCEWSPEMWPYTEPLGRVPDVELTPPLWRRAAEACFYDRGWSWAVAIGEPLIMHRSASMHRPTRVCPRGTVIDSFDGATGKPVVTDGSELDARINARWFGLYQGDRSPRWRRGLVGHWHRVERRKYKLTARAS